MRENSDWQRFATPLGLIRLILLVDWDPIGIFGHIGAMDEYDRYVVEVYDLLCADASKQDIVEYLHDTQTKRIGVRGRDNLEAVVNKLALAYERAQDKAEPPAA